MKSVILSIGDELVLGQTVDTNSAWLSQQLASVGCDIFAHQTVSDDQAMIELAIRENAPRCDCLLISGGLGPTEDDLTRQGLAAVLNVSLELDPGWLAQMEAMFAARKRTMVPANRIQAMLPKGTTAIHNTCGTACGIRARIGSCDIYIMPGVPKEMKAMFTRDILPHIAGRGNGAVILSRTLHTFGMGESNVGQMLGDLMNRQRNPSVGTTVANGMVSLRINARFKTIDEARRQIELTDAACRQCLGHLIFGADDITLPQVIAQLLATSGKTIATAESCTGGMLAGMLTDIPGSSRYFLEGFVTYTNQSKTRILGVRPETLQQHGAVSEPVVAEMAQAARRLSGADFALAISGVAGPDGGTPEKPVGTVCFGFAHTGGVLTRTISHWGDRAMVRDRACKTALTILRCHLLNVPLPF